MISRIRQNRLFKLIALRVVFVFLINTTFQGISYADISALAPNPEIHGPRNEKDVSRFISLVIKQMHEKGASTDQVLTTLSEWEKRNPYMGKRIRRISVINDVFVITFNWEGPGDVIVPIARDGRILTDDKYGRYKVASHQVAQDEQIENARHWNINKSTEVLVADIARELGEVSDGLEERILDLLDRTNDHDRTLIGFVEGIEGFDGHAGGQGIHIDIKYMNPEYRDSEGRGLKEILRHEILAYLFPYKHQKIATIESNPRRYAEDIQINEIVEAKDRPEGPRDLALPPSGQRPDNIMDVTGDVQVGGQSLRPGDMVVYMPGEGKKPLSRVVERVDEDNVYFTDVYQEQTSDYMEASIDRKTLMEKLVSALRFEEIRQDGIVMSNIGCFPGVGASTELSKRFTSVRGGESIAGIDLDGVKRGNAPVGHIIVNGVMDRRGKIRTFGNFGELSTDIPDAEERIQRGELFEFAIAVKMIQDGKIEAPDYRVFQFYTYDRRMPGIAMQRLILSVNEANRIYKRNRKAKAELEPDERRLIIAIATALQGHMDDAVDMLKGKGVPPPINRNVAIEYGQARHEYDTAEDRPKTKFWQRRRELAQAFEDDPEVNDELYEKFFGEGSVMLSLSQHKDDLTYVFAKIIEAEKGKGPPTSDATYEYTAEAGEIFKRLGQLDNLGIQPVRLMPHIQAQFDGAWREVIDPEVLQNIELVAVPDKTMNELGLDGPAYSLGSRIFIRASRYDPEQRLVENNRVTDFGHLLIHELTARHLAYRQQVARYEGDVHHWAARATEHQLETQTLIAHRANLQDRLQEIEEGVRIYYSAPDAPVPVRVEISKEAFLHGLTEDMVKRIVDGASWKNVKGLLGSGRSLILPLEEDEYLHCQNRTLRAIWMKSVVDEATKGPPQMKPYGVSEEGNVLQPSVQFNMDSDGKIRCMPASVHPRGTGFTFEADNEDAMMGEAFRKGFPTGYSLGTGQFVTMTFEGKPVGFVIIAKERTDEERFGTVIHNKSDKAAAEPGIAAKRMGLQQSIAELSRGTREGARELRNLHELGITHTHPYHDQWTIYEDGRLVFYDFTNARSIRAMSRDEFIFRMFNDFRSVYFNTYILATGDDSLSLAGLFRDMMDGIDVRTTPLEEQTNGYFTDEDLALIGEGRLRQATDPVNALPFFVRYFTSGRRGEVSALEGMTLQDLREQNDLVRIFEEIAGPLYDRLVASEPIEVASERDELETTSLRLEIAQVNGELERMHRAHQKELAAIDEDIQVYREAEKEKGIRPLTEDIAMAGPTGTPVIATEENKRLMLEVLTLLNDHHLMRQGKITDPYDPGFPEELRQIEYTNKSDFRFGFAEGKPQIDVNRVYVNADFIMGIDNDEEFLRLARELDYIIYNRVMEGALIGFDTAQGRRFRWWSERFSDWGLEATAERRRPPRIVTVEVPGGFRQAAETMSDAAFGIFVAQARQKVFDEIYRVMDEETFGAEEPPAYTLVKAQLSGGHEGKVPSAREVKPLERTLARAECKEAGFNNFCRRYEYRALPEEFRDTDSRHWPATEELSPRFGIMTRELIDSLMRTGLIDDYGNVRCSDPEIAKEYEGNPYVLIKDLLDGVPITEASFSSTKRYNQFIGMVVRYKLRSGELGLRSLGDERRQRQAMEIVQREVNGHFKVQEGINLFPIDALMLFGNAQPAIHHVYRGEKVRAIGGYVDPLSHTFAALRQMRTDAVPGCRFVARAGILYHDIGRREEYHVKNHEAVAKLGVRPALENMGIPLSEVEADTIEFLVATHAALGKVVGEKAAGRPNLPEIGRILTVPANLEGKISQQMLCELHRRIYRADTTSIKNICWQHLPSGWMRRRPEQAREDERNRAAREWFETVRRRAVAAAAYSYYDPLNPASAQLQDFLEEHFGIPKTKTSLRNKFFISLCQARGYPDLFIGRRIEDLNVDEVVNIVRDEVKKVSPDADPSDAELRTFIENYLLLSDIALAPPSADQPPAAEPFPGSPPGSDVGYTYTVEAEDIRERVEELNEFLGGQVVEEIALAGHIGARFQPVWQEIIDPDVLRRVRLVVIGDELMDEFELYGPGYGRDYRIFIRRSRFREDQPLVENNRMTGFGRFLLHELTARHFDLRARPEGYIEGDDESYIRAYHRAARNIEQQLEMAVLLEHRSGLEARQDIRAVQREIDDLAFLITVGEIAADLADGSEGRPPSITEVAREMAERGLRYANSDNPGAALTTELRRRAVRRQQDYDDLLAYLDIRKGPKGQGTVNAERRIRRLKKSAEKLAKRSEPWLPTIIDVAEDCGEFNYSPSRASAGAALARWLKGYAKSRGRRLDDVLKELNMVRGSLRARLNSAGVAEYGPADGPGDLGHTYDEDKSPEEILRAVEALNSLVGMRDGLQEIELQERVREQCNPRWMGDRPVLIDPKVLEEVRIVFIPVTVMNEVGLSGDAYSLGNRIFIRQTPDNIEDCIRQRLIASSGEITRFGECLIHELVARHLFIREATGDGFRQHRVARALEQGFKIGLLYARRFALEERLERLKSMQDAPGPSAQEDPTGLGELARPEWLGRLGEEIEKRNGGKPLAVINVHGTVDAGVLSKERLVSNCEKALESLRDVDPDDYVYVTVVDVDETIGSVEYCLIVARKARLEEWWNTNVTDFVLTLNSIEMLRDVHNGNGDILFHEELTLFRRQGESPYEVELDMIAAHHSLTRQGLVAPAEARICDFLIRKFSGFPIKATFEHPNAFQHFRRHFLSVRPDETTYSGAPSSTNQQTWHAQIPTPEVAIENVQAELELVQSRIDRLRTAHEHELAAIDKKIAEGGHGTTEDFAMDSAQPGPANLEGGGAAISDIDAWIEKANAGDATALQELGSSIARGVVPEARGEMLAYIERPDGGLRPELVPEFEKAMYSARARSIYWAQGKQAQDFIERIEGVCGPDSFAEVAGRFSINLSNNKNAVLSFEEIAREYPELDIRPVFEYFGKHFSPFVEGYLTDRKAAEFRRILGRVTAITVIQLYRKGHKTHLLKEAIPGSINPVPEVNGRPHYNLGAGVNALRFLLNLPGERRYVLVDNDPFVTGFLEQAGRMLNLGERIEVREEDALVAGRIEPNSAGTVFMRNIAGPGHVDAEDISNACYESLGQSVVPGGQIIVEFRASSAHTRLHAPIILALRRILDTGKGDEWELRFGHFENGRFIENELAEEIAGEPYQLNTYIFTRRLPRGEAEKMFTDRLQPQKDLVAEVTKLSKDWPKGKRRLIRYVEGCMPKELQAEFIERTDEYLEANGLDGPISVKSCSLDAVKQPQEDKDVEILYVVDRKTFLANYKEIQGRVLVIDNIDERSFGENHCSVLPPETVALSLGLVCTDEADSDIGRKTQRLYTLTTGAEVQPDDIEAIVNKRNDEVHQNLHRLTIQAVPISDSIGETIKMLEHFLKHA